VHLPAVPPLCAAAVACAAEAEPSMLGKMFGAPRRLLQGKIRGLHSFVCHLCCQSHVHGFECCQYMLARRDCARYRAHAYCYFLQHMSPAPAHAVRAWTPLCAKPSHKTAPDCLTHPAPTDDSCCICCCLFVACAAGGFVGAWSGGSMPYFFPGSYGGMGRMGMWGAPFGAWGMPYQENRSVGVSAMFHSEGDAVALAGGRHRQSIWCCSFSWAGLAALCIALRSAPANKLGSLLVHTSPCVSNHPAAKMPCCAVPCCAAGGCLPSAWTTQWTAALPWPPRSDHTLPQLLLGV
jgi:hypothetical protein